MYIIFSCNEIQKQKYGEKAFQKYREHGGKRTSGKEIERERNRKGEREKERKQKYEVELNLHLKNKECGDSEGPGERRLDGSLRGGNII